jgi:hypothetical protein
MVGTRLREIYLGFWIWTHVSVHLVCGKPLLPMDMDNVVFMAYLACDMCHSYDYAVYVLILSLCMPCGLST